MSRPKQRPPIPAARKFWQNSEITTTVSSFIPRPNLDLIDLLLGEHASLLTLFRYYEKILTTLDVAGLRAAGAVLEAVLMAHAIDEDGLLFNALQTAQGGVRETLDAMCEEHNELRRLLEELPSIEDVTRARGQVRTVLELAREHFAVEERILFGLARRVLPKENLSTLGGEYARRRGLCASAQG